MIEHARAYVTALTGRADTPMHWRCIHDRDKGAQPYVLHGSVDELWATLSAYNASGYGVFTNINEMDGRGHTLDHVVHCRAHVVDLDGLDAAQQYEVAVAAGASFAVQSSAGKWHLYWAVGAYIGNERYTLLQRKLAQYFNGDKSVIDAPRVMRVPGFFHMKAEPKLVTCEVLSGARYDVSQLETWLAPVNVFDVGGMRSPLGETSMSAPSLDYLNAALAMIDPNDLDRSEWLSLSAAYKQAGWLHTDDETLLREWLAWCARYRDDDPAENRKLWNSVRDTECGWATFLRRTTIKAYMQFGQMPPVMSAPVIVESGSVPPMPTAQGINTDSEMLSPEQCREWFKGCVWIEQMGKMFTPKGRFMNATQFNGSYGGRMFIWTGDGKVTDEAWKAALRSTVWRVPSVDHIRFLPDHPNGEILNDGLGRKGLNIYIPARVDSRQGDISGWLSWLSLLLPDAGDRQILIEYLAHCVKYPGYKIPWAPMLQSAEGTGKTVFRELLAHCLGDMYVYQPKAPELVKSGSIFNAWMRAKLMIVVDEIKIDERRELIEILKPMIADARVEVQSKGVDQDMEDNPANWLFFSNYKDAIPVNANGRRYAIFYSALQHASDIEAAGMGGSYFSNLFRWLRADGYAAIAHYLLNYPIERGAIPMRAPATSSHDQAVAVSRSPMEQIIHDCVMDGAAGFRGGYVSSVALINRCKSSGIRIPSNASVRACLEGLGYRPIGRSERPYIQEDITNRSELYALNSEANINNYGREQGYE